MKSAIQFPDFEKLDIRVGKIIGAAAPEWSAKLLEFTVDFGPEIGTKTILSAIKEWYQPEDFIGKQYMFVANLAERKMGQSVSQGMMLMVDEGEKPLLIEMPDDAEPGSGVR